MMFSTKSNNLLALEGKLTNAIILPQCRITYRSWGTNPESVINYIYSFADWSSGNLIVRSSSCNEDSSKHSLAGHFLSVLNVNGKRKLLDAIDAVFNSYSELDDSSELFIQPMLEKVKMSGVLFSKDPSNNAPYYVINFSHSNMTDAITSGCSNDQVCYIAKTFNHVTEPWKKRLVSLSQELEALFEHEALDIEFAIDSDDKLYLLQVRPLILNYGYTGLSSESHLKILKKLSVSVERFLRPHPYLNGKRSILGIMPDWNPAEIIGVRPRPLALSLYKELITDSTWAYQRNNYGYKQLRSFPLLLSLHGLPYIDVRVSFNSFIPKDIPNQLAEKLVDYYIDELEQAPEKHDKVEFDIIFSCYTLDIKERAKRLVKQGFTRAEVDNLLDSLGTLTNNIIKSDGLWSKDIDKVSALPHRRKKILESDLLIKDKIYWLLEDCKRYGTLPFAGLARAGFIAVQLLRSMVSTDIISEKDYHTFLSSIATVSSNLKDDFATLSLTGFLKKYGHLRPGTYDILSPRYDRAPEKYFDSSQQNLTIENDVASFSLSLEQLTKLKSLLESNGIEHDVISIFSFIKGAIEGREFAKFIFTQSLSDILELLRELGEEYNFSAEDMSYTDISTILDAYSSTEELKPRLETSILSGKTAYQNTLQISLPPLISKPEDVFSFTMPEGEPNFITQQKVSAHILINPSDSIDLSGKIIFVPSADPGFDWLFSHQIAGLITKYGGCNSHMAIRAGELNIPSVIGAGEVLYNKWLKGTVLEIDACNKKVTVIK
ncbi:PEP/pyruvate-binding domain-containing protein [Pseudoalteromonas piscicida]|uniref:PEP/pyruvate-binding domain-containing protein n=1 Tax=Pseudoalteromonas piscicida TaxID=43662 RepID=UPI0030A27618